MRRMFVGTFVMLTASFVLAASATQPGESAKRVRGVLVSVDENTITVQPGVRPTGRPGQDAPPPPPPPVTVIVDEHARLRVDGDAAEVADLTPGMTVDCVSIPARGDRPAVMMVSASSPGIDGTVVKVDGKAIVLHVTAGGDRGEDVRVETDEGTRIRFVGVGRDVAPRAGELGELTTGTRVKVIPDTGVARIIYARPRATEETEATSQPSQ